MIRKSDILLFAGILIIGIAAFVWNTAMMEQGVEVRVVSGRGVYGIYELESDAEVIVTEGGRTNIIEVSNGTVKMQYADCPNGDCVKARAISKAGQSIVCLPNKIIITIEGGGYRLDSTVY